MAGTDHTRRSSRTARAIAGLAVVALAFASVAVAFPENVILLRGKTSQRYVALFTYDVKGNTINGFDVKYTCHGKRLKTDSQLYEIADGGDDSKALADVRSDGSVSFSLKGDISRFSEDGPVPKGSGRLVVKATVKRVGTRRIVKGKAHVNNAKCPSADLTFRSTGRT